MLPLMWTHLAFAALQAAPPGVLFHASYDHWLLADYAAGDRRPVRLGGHPGAEGKVGGALRLDGQSYVEYQAAGNLPQGAGAVALWFKPEDWGHCTYDSILGFNETNEQGFHLERAHPDGRLRLVLGGPGTVSGAKTRSLWTKEPLQNGRWYHVAVTWREDGEAAFYLDGDEVSHLDAPGPVPTDPPKLLVGTGFDGLPRAAKGWLDELYVLDHPATAEEVKALMNLQNDQNRSSLGNDQVGAELTPDGPAVYLGDAAGKLVLGPGAPAVEVGGQTVAFDPHGELSEAPPRRPRLGPGEHRVVTLKSSKPALALRWHLQVQEHGAALLWADVTNRGEAPVRIERIDVFRPLADQSSAFAEGEQRLRVFVDNGSLTGSGSHAFGQPNKAFDAHGALVVTDSMGWSAGWSAVSFQECQPTNRLALDAEGKLAAAGAGGGYPRGRQLEPGQTLRSEVFAFQAEADPQMLLRNWTDLVMGLGDLQPPKHCPNGWNSWYCYRLTITDDLVMANAKVIAERFKPFGLTTIQIDHGWQDRDLVGNWVPNDRFPNGLDSLSERLQKMGLSLGLWSAVSQVSEFTPQAKRPELLMHTPDGELKIATKYWFWEPHGCCYTLDPTSSGGLAEYRQIGEQLRGYGCTYSKNDFQGNLLTTDVATQDGDVPGVPTWHKAMRAFAAGRGPEMAYHACNAPLNMVAGLCDVAWVHRDLGNPGARWDHLRAWANDFACRAHVSGKFYWSDPDYLQVAQGGPGEDRVRMAFVALGGGPMFLSDRLPELDEEQLNQLAQCLPSYGETMTPVDLFTRDGYPQLWSLPVNTGWGSWQVLGLFNLDDAPARLALPFSQPGECLVYDYFQHKLLGRVMVPAGDVQVVWRVPVPMHDVRVLKIVRVEDHPFVLSTDLHLTQGGVELPTVTWDAAQQTLFGSASRAPWIKGHVFVYVPEGYEPIGGTLPADRVLSVPVEFKTDKAAWSVRFRR